MDKRDKETIINKKRRKNIEQNTYRPVVPVKALPALNMASRSLRSEIGVAAPFMCSMCVENGEPSEGRYLYCNYGCEYCVD